MGKYGIDLGTTYSCIATLDRNDNPVIIRNPIDESETMASAVFFESAGHIVVGNSAKASQETDPDKVVQGVKRYIGKEDGPTYEYFGEKFNAIDISKMILTRLKDMVEEQGEKVESAVITCPAYFGIPEKLATRRAAEKAGIEVEAIINEPTAAALSYCARQFQEDRTIMVFDLGGGTFDVTILKMAMVMDEVGQEIPRIEVIKSGGNDRLGGIDWDEVLFDLILEKCCEQTGYAKEDLDKETMVLIKSITESVKKKLSQVDAPKISISVNGKQTKIIVTRKDFEELTSHLVDKTMGYVEDTLRKAQELEPGLEIDTVLLVGGSTKMPMIRNAVETRFPGKVLYHEPELAVAKGAAIYAYMPKPDPILEPPTPEPIPGSEDETEIKRRIGMYELIDKTLRSFGAGVINKDMEFVCDNVIMMNTPMPAEGTGKYSVMYDDQQVINVPIFENMSMEKQITPCIDEKGNPQKSRETDYVRKIGDSLEMQLPSGAKKGDGVEVTFVVDASGVYVKAVYMPTGESVDAKISMNFDDNEDFLKNTNICEDPSRL